VLGQNDAEHPDPTGRYSLNEAHEQLVLLINHGVEHARQEHIRLLNRRQFNFGVQQLAPTTMGNIANTVQSYAISRYNLNLDIFWSRLQKAIQRDDKSYALVQDSKTQLDFLVTSCWLTMAWTVIWAPALAVAGHDWRVFLAAALGGPVIARLWYVAAVEQYRAFADVLRTAVDLFRFDLLKELRLAPPTDLHTERGLWDALNQLAGYGEDPNLRYQHPKSS
jgi:hypothetical protein